MRLLATALFIVLIGCAHNGVIGVAYNQYGIVRQVFSGSPAEKAGIKVNDKILNIADLRGEVGTICTVNVQREDNIMTLLIPRIDINSLK